MGVDPWLWSSSARQKSPHGTTTVDTMAGDVTHTILAVEDRGLRPLVEGMNTTLVAVVDTTRRGITAAPAVVAQGQGALKAIVPHRLQEDTRMSGKDNMVTMEGEVVEVGVEVEVEKATVIGKYAVLPLSSM